MKKVFSLICVIFLAVLSLSAQITWKHISSKSGALEVPNAGKQQTSAAVGDFDGDCQSG